MATNFNIIVAASAQDYTTLNAALASFASVDITASTTVRVFGVSSVIGSPSIADGDSVVGLTSAATGTCIHLNVAGTQIAIKGITGTFQSGETVKKVTDVTKEVVLSNAGDSIILNITCNAFTDTTLVSSTTITTGASNYVAITAATMPSLAAQMAGGYILHVTGAGPALLMTVGYLRLTGLQFWNSSSSSLANQACSINLPNAASDLRITRCIFRLDANASTGAARGLIVTQANTLNVYKIWNNVFYDCVTSGATTGAGIRLAANFTVTASYVYDNTFYNCSLGINHSSVANAPTGVVLINNGFYSNGLTSAVSYSTGTGAFSSSSDYNASDLADSIGTHKQNSVTPSFTNAGIRDLHIVSGDTAWGGKGVDLSADANLPVSTDFDSATRVLFDIGATIQANSSIAPKAGFLNSIMRGA